VQRTHLHVDFEISGIDIQLFVGIEGKLMSGVGVGDFADDDVGGGFTLRAVGIRNSTSAVWN